MEKVMKVRDLIARLQECEPEGTVTMSLDGAILYDDGEPGEIEYGFDPDIECLCSRPDAERSDRVHLLLSKVDTERIVKTRREHCCEEAAPAELSTTSSSAITFSAPVAVAIALSRDVYTTLLAVVESCNRAHENNKGATTHGRLDIPNLLGMLAEDAAMTDTRPGSWEGANLQQVLDSHGYYYGC